MQLFGVREARRDEQAAVRQKILERRAAPDEPGIERALHVRRMRRDAVEHQRAARLDGAGRRGLCADAGQCGGQQRDAEEFHRARAAARHVSVVHVCYVAARLRSSPPH